MANMHKKDSPMPPRQHILTAFAHTQEQLAHALVVIAEDNRTRPAQYVSLLNILAAYLPATITLDQRTPRGVITANIVMGDEVHRLTVNHRGIVSYI
jgi:hypothetical protein